MADEGIMTETERIGIGVGLALVQGLDLSADLGHVLALAQRGRVCLVKRNFENI